MRTLETFVLKTDHLRLLARAYIDWNGDEYGAPTINCKRPYGNSSVGLDIAEILAWPISTDDGLTPQQEDEAFDLHKGTQAALQIVLSHLGELPGSLVGIWQLDGYDYNKWRKVTGRTSVGPGPTA